MRSYAALLLSLLVVGVAWAQAPADIATRDDAGEVLSTSSEVLYYFNELIQQQTRENVDALSRIDQEYRQALSELSAEHSTLLQEINNTQREDLAALSEQGLTGEERSSRQREIQDRRDAAWAEALEAREARANSLREAYDADRLAQREVNESLITQLREEQQRRLAMLVDGPIPLEAIRNAIGGGDGDPQLSGDEDQAADEQPDPMVPVRPDDPRPEVEEVVPEGPVFVAQTITTSPMTIIDSGELSERGQEVADLSEFHPITIATDAMAVVDSGELSARGQEVADLPEFTPIVIDTPPITVIDGTE